MSVQAILRIRICKLILIVVDILENVLIVEKNIKKCFL